MNENKFLKISLVLFVYFSCLSVGQAQITNYATRLTAPTSINQTLPVGSVDGALSVSPSGAATYQIPIKTQPGVKGLAPEIALTYNSQGGNGIAGYGWILQA